MRYVQGLAVAVLIAAGYLLASGGLTASPQPSSSPAPSVVVQLPPLPAEVAASPMATVPGVVNPAQVVIGTPAPRARPTPTPRHVLHSGPPLH